MNSEQSTKQIVRSFRDLKVWQRAMDLATAVYRFTEKLPREEVYGLRSQMRRCSVSVPSNIAEGQGRLNTKEFRHFLSIARGSICELQTQMELARRLGKGDPKEIEEAELLSHEIGKMIFTILGKLTP